MFVGDDEQFYMSQNVGQYITQYTKYQKEVVQNIEDPTFIETIKTLFQAMKTLLEYSVKYTETYENQLAEQYDEDEAEG